MKPVHETIPLVSVIVPARNTAETIEETLGCLLQQQYHDWEAIVVDDGSADDTLALASRCAAEDARIRVIRGTGRGVSAARNLGIEMARGTWLLFLDADDRIAPEHLARMTAEAGARPELDVVHCGWARFGTGGKMWPAPPPPPQADLFPYLATHSVFAIHACLVRRSVVVRAGGFDPELTLCQDHDLWQRIARGGARFGAVPDVLAYYRTHASSCSRDMAVSFDHGKRVVVRGHGPDERVAHPAPEHVNGQSREELPGVLVNLGVWCAGYAIGIGQDTSPLLARMEPVSLRSLDPDMVAGSLFDGFCTGEIYSLEGQRSYWGRAAKENVAFLAALEARLAIPGLARGLGARLERKIAAMMSAAAPATWGRTYAVRIEITEPVAGVPVPEVAEYLYAEVLFQGASLGAIQLPACDGFVSGRLLADRIAAEYAWEILRRFFEITVYPGIEVHQGEDGASFYRDGVRLAPGVCCAGDSRAAIHDSAGWTVFLQELWGMAGWPADAFYDPAWPDPLPAEAIHARAPVPIEVSHALPDLLTQHGHADIDVFVGGAGLARLNIASEEPAVPAQHLRVEIALSAGYELCVAAVREGILGRPVDGTPLRSRLASRAASRIRGPAALLDSERAAAIIGRRASAPIGTSASRVALFPKETGRLVLEAATLESLPVHRRHWRWRRSGLICYAPAWIEASAGHCAAPIDGRRLEPDGVTSRLPVLMYHRVAPEDSPAMARWRVHPDVFEAQIRHLAETGFRSATFSEWQRAASQRAPLSGHAVVLTFDDGYRDFQDYAWPILKRYGFSAYIFLVTGLAGGVSQWVAGGENLPLLSWREIRRLREDGVRFGSHTASHSRLTFLSPANAMAELLSSRVEMTRRLGEAPEALAYPYGDTDEVIRYLAGACGYLYGLSVRPGFCKMDDRLLNLPRVEISGSDNLESFAAKSSAAAVAG